MRKKNLKKKLLIKNDYNSVIRSIKYMSADFSDLTGIANDKYNLVYYNVIVNCHEINFCDLPWEYFNSIGIPDINNYIDKFLLNNPHFEKHEYFNPGQSRKITPTDKTKAEQQYNELIMYRRDHMPERTQRLFKKEYEKMSDEQDQTLKLPTLQLITYLNNVTIPKTVLPRCLQALKLFPDNKELIIKLYQSIQSGETYLIRPNRMTINYRLGGKFNNLPKEIRRFVLNKDDGCVELDIKSAHLSFLQAKTDLNLPGNVIELISKETGLLKARVKACVVATIYGGINSPKDALITDDARRELHVWGRSNERAEKSQAQELTDYTTISQNAHYQAIRAAVDGFMGEIERDSGVIDAFGVRLESLDKTDIKTVMAAYYSSIEKKLLMKLLPLTQYGFRILSDEHDGCTIYISNPERKDSIIKMCKNAVEKEAKRLRIKTTLEIK